MTQEYYFYKEKDKDEIKISSEPPKNAEILGNVPEAVVVACKKGVKVLNLNQLIRE